MSNINLFKLDSWKRHERDVMEVFEAGLQRLRADTSVPAQEDDLNIRLLHLVRRENYRLLREGRGTNSNIYYECNNQPAMDDVSRSKRLWKRPDFTCGLVDAQQGIDLFFVIECKRLGRPPNSAWIVNKNYVENGVARFVSNDWSYGRGTASGAMVGYLQTMEPDEIFVEVNENHRLAGLPELQKQARDLHEPGAFHYEQRLERTFPQSPFTIKHVWVDLRQDNRPAVSGPAKSQARRALAS